MSGPRVHWLGLAVGLGFAGLGAYIAWSAWTEANVRRALALHGIRTEAEILRYETVQHRFTQSFRPVFRFTTLEGRRVIATSGVADEEGTQPSLTRVPVVYDPGNPATVRQASAVPEELGAEPWIAGGLALVVFTLSALFVREALPGRRR